MVLNERSQRTVGVIDALVVKVLVGGEADDSAVAVLGVRLDLARFDIDRRATNLDRCEGARTTSAAIRP
jgi:hypothetical protein